MNRDEAAFLRAIQDDPSDEGVRLVYADWLEENGQADRAEFIRVQIRRPHLYEGDPDRIAYKEREDELWQRHQAEWAADLPATGVGSLEFRGGMPCGLIVNAWEDFTHRMGSIFQRLPISELTVRSLRYLWTDAGGGAPASHELDEQRAWALQSLAACPQAARLTALRLSQLNLSDRAVQGLLSAPHLKHLRHLDVSSNSITLEGFCELVNTDHLPALRRLKFRKNAIGYERPNFHLFLDGPARLEWLDLSEHHFDSDTLMLLTRSPTLSQLRVLYLDQNSIGGQVLRLMVERESLDQLRGLSLYLNPLGDEGVRALLQARFRDRLEYLDLGMTQLHFFGLRALCQCDGFTALRELNLDHNPLGDGVRELTEWPALDHLQMLHLYACNIGPAGVDSLSRCERLENLLWLDLRNNHIGDEGLKSLAASPHLGNLRWLQVTGNQIHAEGANALADSPYLEGLRSLDIWGNHLPEGVCQRLKDRFGPGVVT